MSERETIDQKTNTFFRRNVDKVLGDLKLRAATFPVIGGVGGSIAGEVLNLVKPSDIDIPAAIAGGIAMMYLKLIIETTRDLRALRSGRQLFED